MKAWAGLQWHGLGEVYYALGRYHQAKVELEEAARLDSSFREDDIIKELGVIIKELDAISPKRYFHPKPTIFDYGVDQSFFQGGEVIDDFMLGSRRVISLKYKRLLGDEYVFYYKYQTFVFEPGSRKPSLH